MMASGMHTCRCQGLASSARAAAARAPPPLLLPALLQRRSCAAPSPPAAAAGALEIVRLPPEVLAAGGLDPSRDRPANVAAFQDMLGTAFLPVNLRHPGLRVLNIDPPVLTCDDFLPPDACDALLGAARASGRMSASRVGGASGDAADGIRTSSTLAITREVLAAVPDLEAPLQQLLDAALQLLGQGLDTTAISGMQFVRPSSQAQVCPELPQVAHYLPGQHFAAHEDGFPGPIALEKGYNRRATLLVYLNDVPQGGATRFEHLGLAVQPQRGKALLFFPAFSGGKSDARTLHTAEDAVEGCEKWVFQLWLCTGLPRRPPIDAAAAAAKQLAEARRGGSSSSSGGAGGSSGGGGGAKKSKRPSKKKR